MKTAGIVAEYNPFHTGHAHQIARTREALGEGTAIVAVMSGNWVQQADCAIADKWTRARLALMGGADLVLELPTVWALSSAETFARGAVSILHAAGVVEVLSFGSEWGRVEPLCRVAQCLDGPDYLGALNRFVDQGMSFAAARQGAVQEVLGEEPAALLASPNNNLGVEYIRALNALNSKIQPMTVRREGSGHNAVARRGGEHGPGAALPDRPRFVSATQIRLDLLEGAWDRAEPYLVPGGRAVLEGCCVGLPGLNRVERALLARLRTMGAEDWARLPDSGQAEGLPKRLERTGRTCPDMEAFFTQAKTRRYTHARLRRLVLWAFLGLGEADRPEKPPYLRVLGFNNRGRALLREMKDRAALPILTKPGRSRELDEAGRRLFELEARCTDLYGLCFPSPPAPGREWTEGPVILREPSV